jgi:preprotein translocase subunit SecG
MTTVVIVIHLMVVLAMIGLVLLQRSEGGALGIGGGSGAFMTGRGAANVLTRATAFLAVAFFATSLGLALLARIEARPSDILDVAPGAAAPAESQAPAAPVAGGAPENAQDVLDALGGAEPGPQEAPAAPAEGAVAPEADDAAAPGPQAPPAAPAP